jgi:hypothetical protein
VKERGRPDMTSKLRQIDLVVVFLIAGIILAVCLLIKGLTIGEWKTVVVHSELIAIQLLAIGVKRFIDKKLEGSEDE